MALDNVALARDGLVGCNLHGCELETGTGLLETRRAYLVAVGEATGQRREALVAKQLLLGVQHTKVLTGEGVSGQLRWSWRLSKASRGARRFSPDFPFPAE